jgi:hypothetical protein
MEAKLQSFLTSVIDGYESPVSRPSRFTPGTKRNQYPLDKRLVVPQNKSYILNLIRSISSVSMTENWLEVTALLRC